MIESLFHIWILVCEKDLETFERSLPEISDRENFNIKGLETDLGISIDLKSADKEIKAVMPEKSKNCVTAFNKKLVTTFQ